MFKYLCYLPLALLIVSTSANSISFSLKDISKVKEIVDDLKPEETQEAPVDTQEATAELQEAPVQVQETPENQEVTIKTQKQSVAPQKLTNKELEVAKNIASNCLFLKEIDYSQSENSIKNQLVSFRNSKKGIDKNLQKLDTINPSARNSNHIIRKQPFSQLLSNCQAKINSEEQKQSDFASGKSAIPPTAVNLFLDGHAVSSFNDAMFDCKVGKNTLKKSPSKLNQLEGFYNSYKSNISTAIEADKRILEYKKDRIDDCNTNFESKYLSLTAQQEKQQKEKQQKEQEAKLAAEEQRRKKEAEIEEMEIATAKSLGYEGINHGITFMLDNLNDGYTTLDGAKRYLIQKNYVDKFKVINVVGNLVIYGFTRENYEFVQIAVEKEPGRFYGENAKLPNRLFSVTGTETFVSALGAQKQLIVLKEITQ